MDRYYNKYLIYKTKYLNLKNKINVNQNGGTITTIETTETDIKEYFESLQILNKTLKTFIVDSYKLHLIKVKLNDDDMKPVLFVIPGMSHKSFRGTVNVVLSKLDELSTKFKTIYCLEYDSFKSDQNLACSKRDNIVKNEKDKDPYKPELLMNSNIALQIHEIIKSLDLDNVHLLGKCNGGWVASLLLSQSNIYKGLYLAVPGIPYSVKNLNDIDRKRLNEINFVFGWTKQDELKFHWEKFSFEEKERYDFIMKGINPAKYISYMFVNIDANGSESKADSKIYHELFPDMITKIIQTL